MIKTDTQSEKVYALAFCRNLFIHGEKKTKSTITKLLFELFSKFFPLNLNDALFKIFTFMKEKKITVFYKLLKKGDLEMVELDYSKIEKIIAVKNYQFPIKKRVIILDQ